ncbi:beta strand repeat-containing protein [Zavarzinia sp.]|uniref:beta strand repeat-containing protein n=1 Tax=Zavarzinia sp. TaxID=2027920 RepID=UPI00356901EA
MRNGATVNAGVNNLQTVTINPNVTGGTFTISFQVPDGRGGFDLRTTAPIAYNASAIDVYKALSPILNPNGSTIDIDPEFDRVTRDPSKPYTDNFAVQRIGDTFLITMQGAYRDLKIDDIDTRALVTRETALDPVTNEAPAAEVTLGSTLGTAVLDATAPRATTVDLAATGLAASGTWSVGITLRGITTTHTFSGGATLDAVAAGLAASINAGAADVFTATSDGAVLVVANRDGSTFATSLSRNSVNAGSVQVIDRSTPTEAMVNLDGTPATNEIWQITLDDGATGPVTLSYQVLAADLLATDPLAKIAFGLAALINATANADFAAVAEGDSVVIVRRDGTLFSATPAIQPAGQPSQTVSEAWTVTLLSATSAALAGLPAGTPHSFTYNTVPGVDTQASIARHLAELINADGLPEFHATSDGEVLHIDNLAGNVFTTTFAANGTPKPLAVEAASATIATRIDGINYYNIENLSLRLGAGDDVLNVRGTTATTSIDTGAGDDALYVSSAANAAVGAPVDFLTGNLRDISGALNIDAGTGQNRLLISGEAGTLDNGDIVLTDQVGTVAGAPASAEIAITGLTGGDNSFGWVDMAQGLITFQAAPAAPTPGNFGGGVTLWTGFGADTIWVDGAADQAGVRTITTLNTGLGDDTVGVNLTAGQDGVFVLNTQGPWNDYPASAYPGISDIDTVLGAGNNPANGPAGAYESTAGLIVFGGQGDDTIVGGSGRDMLFGDRGQIVSYEYVGGVPNTGVILEVLGNGGPGDFTDGAVRNPDLFESTFPLVGGNDTIDGREGDNLVVGGAGADLISTGAGAEVILGDNGMFGFTTNGASQAILTSAQTTDTLDQPTWGDVIVTGDGDNVVLAGMGDDHVNDPAVSLGATPSAGSDIVIGDNGYFTWDSLGNPVSFGSASAGQVSYTPAAGPANPVGGVSTGVNGTLAYGDLDSDGDLDLVVGQSDGTLAYYVNTGTSTAPLYAAAAVSPFAGIDVGAQSTPSLVDLDHDGDLDLVVGGDSGTLAYFENTGTGAAPVYVAVTGAADPFAGVVVVDPLNPSTQSTPVLADLDGDGDLDLVVGQSDGTLDYYENTGSDAAPVFQAQTGAANPLDGIGAGMPSTPANPITQATPAFADVDGDGDLDLVLGRSDGTLGYFENTGTGVAPVYVERSGAANPFDGIDVGTQSTPSFADLDGDGDLDLVAGGTGGALAYYENTSTGAGGNDVIVVGTTSAGDGANVVVGGFGDDTIVAGTGADILLGDNGAALYTTGTADLLRVQSTGVLNNTGGNDTIAAGEGGNLVLAGVGSDTVTAGAGVDLLIGDNGQINWMPTGELSQVMTTLPALGAADSILAGDGDNIVAGGVGADTITGGVDDDLILGDNGLFDFTTDGTGAAILTAAISTDVVDQPAWGDTIVTGAGDNIVLAGVGSDHVNDPAVSPTAVPSPGDEIVIGDNGQVAWDINGVIASFSSTQPGFGGDEVIVVGGGANIVVGGFGNDTILAGGGVDILLGDNGLVTYYPGTDQLQQAMTTDGASGTGGNDTILAGDGNNLIMAGAGADTVTGGAGNDLIMGDNGVFDFTLAAGGAAVLTGATTTDTTAADPLGNPLAWDDTIVTGGGDNIVMAGLGADHVNDPAATPAAVLTAPVFADLNGDGLLDAVVGAGDGTLRYYVNAGTAASPVYVEQTGAANPFDGIDVGTAAAPSFADLDGDGDLDAVVGAGDGTLHYLMNSGTASAPAYVEQTGAANPFDGIGVGTVSTPSVGDVNGDGLLDVVVGAGDGTLHFLENTGATTAPAFVEQTGAANPFAGIDVGTVSAPALADVNGVGLLDVVVGASDGTLAYLENTGPATAPVFVAQTGTANPFDGIDVGSLSAPAVADVNGDGLLDVVLGASDGTLTTLDNTGSAAAPAYVPVAAAADPLAGVAVGQNGGNDIVIGDNGFVNWDAGALLTQFGSTDPALGGGDVIVVGDGTNIVVGGNGNDTIATGVGADIVLGDDGQVDYVTTDGNSADIDSITSTSTTAYGGADTILTGAGDDIVIGGRMDDVIDAGSGDNLVIGDSGLILADTVDAPQMAGQPITLGLVQSIQLDDGGNDVITTTTGNDIVVGGFGADTLATGAGNDTVFGDNGMIDYTDAVPTLIQTTDTVAATGGDDVIDAGDGNSIVFGGVGADTVTSGSGADIVFGDNGAVVNDASGNLVQAITSDPLLGGNDTLATGAGNDVAMGGAFSDLVTSAGGNDILFGDGGSVTYAGGGANVLIESVDTLFGGNDTLNAGTGADILIGGQGEDLLYGTLDEDLLFGGNVAVTLQNGLVTSIESDTQDLVTEAMFKSFNALSGEDGDKQTAAALLRDLPGYVTVVPDRLSELLRLEPLLDVTVFQNVFDLSLVSQPAHLFDNFVFHELFSSGVVTISFLPAHNWIRHQNDGGDSTAQVGGEQNLAEEAAMVLTFTQPPVADLDERSGDALVAVLGVAGLSAVQQPQSRGRRPWEMTMGAAGRALLRAREALESFNRP